MVRLRVVPATDVPVQPPPDLKAGTHRSRLALNRVVADPDAESAWDDLSATYTGMAEGWSAWADAQRYYLAPVLAGLRHSRPVPWLLEVACGTGQATQVLTGHAPLVVATDASAAMVARAPALERASYLVADVRHLPVPADGVPMLVGLNAVPCIEEFRRVLGDQGQLLWCSSFGPGTPLYVEPERIAALLGPDWSGVTGRAGHGDWLLMTRTG